MSPLVAPSILSADFAELAAEARKMETAGADWLHVDVMDGHFVPNLTIGPVVVKSLKKHTALPLDVHLMITDPAKYAEPFARAGAWSLTFHVEAVDDPRTVLKEFRRLGVRRGLSLRPKTPAEAIYPFLEELDVVLVMTVEPGFGGQAFMADVLPKMSAIAERIRSKGYRSLVEVDGGIDAKTGVAALKAGAQVLVAGNAIFNAADPVGAVRALKGLAA